METWDFIRQQGLNYHLGCALKYIVRAGYKDSKEQDLKKAIHYLQNELDNSLLESSNSNGYGGGIPLSVFPGHDSDDDPEIFDR